MTRLLIHLVLLAMLPTLAKADSNATSAQAAKSSVANTNTHPTERTQLTEDSVPLKNVPAENLPVENIVITGTRTPKLLEDSPVAIDVIQAQELEAVTTGTVAQILDYIPGVSIGRNQKDGYTVMMQGFSANRVLVLVDSMALISPTGEEVDLDQISALDINRIEVIRGAASVLYGSSAMGGVINIITNNPNQQTNGARIQAELGSYDKNHIQGTSPLHKINGTGQYSLNNWQTKITAQYINNPGFDYAPNFDKTLSTKKQSAGSVEKTFVHALLKKQWGNLVTTYRPQFFEEYKEKNTGILPGFGIKTYSSDVTQQQHDISLNHTQWQTHMRINQHQERSGESGSLREADIQNIDVDAQYTIEGNNAVWVTGLRHYRQKMDQQTLSGITELDEVSRFGSEVFLQSDYFVSDTLELIAGVRHQYDSDFGNHYALRLNSMWQPEALKNYNIKWRTSVGEGYRVPNLKERFYVFDHSNLGYIIEGNVNLKPETSTTASSSVAFTLPYGKNNALNFELNAHSTWAEDFIETQQSNVGNTNTVVTHRYQNTSAVRMRGFDIAMKPQKNQNWSINYSYLDARNTGTNTRLTERPYHQIKTNYWYNAKRWPIKILFYGIYEKDEYSEKILTKQNVYRLNARLQWQVTPEMEIKLGVDNVFNSHNDETIDTTLQYDPTPVGSRYAFTIITMQL